MIGGYINFDENGYDILAKEYRRELKYSAGNLMHQNLREMVDNSVQKLRNFFAGFMTFEKIRHSCGNPIRKIRPLITRDKKKHLNLDQKVAKKNEAESKTKDSRLAKQLEKIKKDST